MSTIVRMSSEKIALQDLQKFSPLYIWLLMRNDYV